MTSARRYGDGWRRVADRAYRLCEYCLVHEEDVYHGCEVDHIRSVKHGGLTVMENLAFACFHCNRHKGTDLGSVSVRTGTLIRFYHPREDRWIEHFMWSEGRIEPLTEIGEVTGRLLEFNHPERVAFRRILAESLSEDQSSDAFHSISRQSHPKIWPKLFDVHDRWK